MVRKVWVKLVMFVKGILWAPATVAITTDPVEQIDILLRQAPLGIKDSDGPLRLYYRFPDCLEILEDFNKNYHSEEWLSYPPIQEKMQDIYIERYFVGHREKITDAEIRIVLEQVKLFLSIRENLKNSSNNNGTDNQVVLHTSRLLANDIEHLVNHIVPIKGE